MAFTQISLRCFSCLAALVLGIALLHCTSHALGKSIRVGDVSDIPDDDDDDMEAWKPKRKPSAPATGDDEDEEEFRLLKLPYAFIKLRYDLDYTIEEVKAMGNRWGEVLKTGGTHPKFFATDKHTIMVTINDKRDYFSVKDYVLSQEEVYEFLVGDKAFRRPGDPTLEEVAKKQAEGLSSKEKISRKKKKKKKSKKVKVDLHVEL